MYCNNCGKELMDGDRFCNVCGAPIIPNGSNVYETGNVAINYANNNNNNINSNNKKKKSKAPIIIAIILILFAAIGAGVFYVMQSGILEYKKQIKIAQEYLDEKDYEKAIAALEKALKIDPKSEEAQNLLESAALDYADELFDDDEYEDAIDVLESALEYLKSRKIEKKIKEIEEKMKPKPAPEATEEAAPEEATEETSEVATDAFKGKIGIAFPTQSSTRWINDGTYIKKQLEELGYEVDLLYAEDDVQAQYSQIENLIMQGVDLLIIAPIDSTALITVEEKAKDAGIPIIAYDRLLMDTDAVSYYVTFSSYEVGKVIGEYIVNYSGASVASPKSIEFFMGSPDDNNAYLLYEGLMDEIGPLLYSGALNCWSGEVSLYDTCTFRWDKESAKKRCELLLMRDYSKGNLDICVSAYDGLSYGCMEALEEAGFTGADWPLMITGQDAELLAIKSIIAGKQTMTVFKDTRILADACARMADDIFCGRTVEIDDVSTFDNGCFVVPTYCCVPVAVDINNYREVIIGSGYYTEEQLR